MVRRIIHIEFLENITRIDLFHVICNNIAKAGTIYQPFLNRMGMAHPSSLYIKVTVCEPWHLLSCEEMTEKSKYTLAEDNDVMVPCTYAEVQRPDRQ